MKHTKKQSGFTLVELAIVLVIIGLIVGGVLAGSDLIKAATVQKAVKQVNDLNTAANTFRTKYNDLPGDLKNPHLVFSAVTNGSATVLGKGDGNGYIEGHDGAGNTSTGGASLTSGEVTAFFYEMAQAGYIKENITGISSGVDINAVTITPTQFKTTFQPTALGNDSYFVVAAGAATTTTNNGKNYITMVGAPTANAAAGVAGYTRGLVPVQASNLDSKLDDGNAQTGAVISMDDAGLIPATVAGGVDASATAEADGTDCFDTVSGAYFASFTQKSCNLSIRASF